MPTYTYVASRAVIEGWTAAQSVPIGYAAVSSDSAAEAWEYSASSIDPASDGLVIVPSDAPTVGRWLRQTDYDATIALFQKSIPGSQIEPGTIGGTELQSDVNQAISDAHVAATQALADGKKTSADLIASNVEVITELQLIAAAMAQGSLSAYQDLHEIRQTLSSQVGDAKAYADIIVIAATGPNSAIAGQLSTFSASLAGKADVTVTDALASRVTATETSIDSIGGRTTTIENALPGKASTTVTDALSSRITTAEGNITSLAGRTTAIENALPGFATTTITDSLASRMTTAEGNITSIASRTTTIENALPGKASQTSVDALTSTVSSLNGVVTSQGSAITSLQGVVGGSSSQAILQLYQTTTPSDATSRFVVSLSQNSGGTSHAAAFFMDATSSGSRLVGAADLIAFYASKFAILKPDGSTGFQFDTSTGLITTNGIALNALSEGYAYDVMAGAGSSASGNAWDFGDVGTSLLNPTYSFTLNGNHLMAFLPSGTPRDTGILTNGYDCLALFFGAWKSTTSDPSNIEVFIRSADFTGVVTNYASQNLNFATLTVQSSFCVIAKVPASQTRFWPVIHAGAHDVTITNASLAFFRLKR